MNRLKPLFLPQKKYRQKPVSQYDWASRDLNPDPCGLDPKS